MYDISPETKEGQKEILFHCILKKCQEKILLEKTTVYISQFRIFFLDFDYQGGFSVTKFDYNRAFSHMTCYNSMPLIG